MDSSANLKYHMIEERREIFTDNSLRRCNAAQSWCVRIGAGGGLKLTQCYATFHDTEGKLVFEKRAGAAQTTTMQGVELQILRWYKHDDLIYVYCEDHHIYRLLINKSHQKRRKMQKMMSQKNPQNVPITVTDVNKILHEYGITSSVMNIALYQTAL